MKQLSKTAMKGLVGGQTKREYCMSLCCSDFLFRCRQTLPPYACSLGCGPCTEICVRTLA